MPNDNAPRAGRTVPFDDLRVRVGARLQLVFERFGRVVPLASALIGYLEQQYVIVRTPLEGGLRVAAENGERLKVRLFTGTHVAEFATSVLRQFAPPTSYWHLEYPASVQAVTLRAAPRARVDLPVHVRSAASADLVEARLVDLSTSGAQIVADRALGERDGVVTLSFAVDHGADAQTVDLAVSASIRAVRPLAANGDAPSAYAHGVQFDTLGERERILVENFVLNRLIEGNAAAA
jgi:c-di-GMP-binding flagellar brake protein YcgR